MSVWFVGMWKSPCASKSACVSVGMHKSSCVVLCIHVGSVGVADLSFLVHGQSLCLLVSVVTTCILCGSRPVVHRIH